MMVMVAGLISKFGLAVPNPQLYSWIEWAVYLCIAAALESPLFIAFSVLHQELQPRDTFSQSPVAASAAISVE